MVAAKAAMRLAPGVIVLACLLALPARAEAQQRTFESIMAEAVQAKKAGKLNRVVDLLRDAYEIRPAPELMNNLGRVLEELGRYRESFEAYKKVADDPEADPNLRALDASRMAIVQGKLGKAWVLPKLKPDGVELRVDGEKPTAPPGQEFSSDPGLRALEMRSPAGDEVFLRFRELTLDVRTVIEQDLDNPPASSGRLLFEGLTPALESITVNGYDLRADVSGLAALRLPSGRYRVEIKQEGKKALGVDANVGAGTTMSLTELLPKPKTAKPKPKPKAEPKPEPKPEPVVEESAPDEGGGAGIWPWVTAGAGLALVGGGVGMHFLAEADRDEIRDAKRDAQGRLLISLADAQTIEDDANTKDTIGVVVGAVGAAAIIGGVTWWLLAPSGGDEAGFVPSVLVTPRSVFVGGRF